MMTMIENLELELLDAKTSNDNLNRFIELHLKEIKMLKARIADLEAALILLKPRPIKDAPKNEGLIVNAPDVIDGFTLAYLKGDKLKLLLNGKDWAAHAVYPTHFIPLSAIKELFEDTTK